MSLLLLLSHSSSGAISYTLPCATGAYALSGKPATLTYVPGAPSGVAYALPCAVGSYVYAGQAATLNLARKLTLAAGSYAYAGLPMTMVRLVKMPLAVGTYTYAGSAAAFNYSRSMLAGTGAYTYSGKAATLTYVVKGTPYALDCATGAYIYAGGNARATFGVDMIIGPTASDIATAVLAAMQAASPPVPVNVTQMNSAPVIGTGQDADKWRGVGVPS